MTQLSQSLVSERSLLAGGTDPWVVRDSLIIKRGFSSFPSPSHHLRISCSLFKPRNQAIFPLGHHHYVSVEIPDPEREKEPWYLQGLRFWGLRSCLLLTHEFCRRCWDHCSSVRLSAEFMRRSHWRIMQGKCSESCPLAPRRCCSRTCSARSWGMCWTSSLRKGRKSFWWSVSWSCSRSFPASRGHRLKSKWRARFPAPRRLPTHWALRKYACPHRTLFQIFIRCCSLWHSQQWWVVVETIKEREKMEIADKKKGGQASYLPCTWKG